MTRRVKLILAAATVVVAGSVMGGLAVAGGTIGGDGDEILAGATLERATEAALLATGGGTVTEAEIGDDGAAYEVEVRLSDGSQVEVALDEHFEVVGTQADDDGAGDDADEGNGESVDD